MPERMDEKGSETTQPVQSGVGQMMDSGPALKEGIGVEVPTVGRIVHFYTMDMALHFNGQGQGPYPAIVTQGNDLAPNLKVLPPFGSPYDQGSVPHRFTMPGAMFWWEWPPRI